MKSPVALFVGFFMTANLWAQTTSPKSQKAFPFKTQEKISYLPSEETNDSFNLRGVIERHQFENRVQKRVYFYDFDKIKTPKITKALCEQFSKQMFGDLKESVFQMHAIKLKNSPAVGQVCMIQLRDSDPRSSVREKHFVVANKKMRMVGFIFNYSEYTDSTAESDEISFISSLR